MPAPRPPPLQPKEYGPDSTPAEVEALRSQIYWYDAGIAMYIEAPVISVFQIQTYAARLAEIAATVDSFHLIIDLVCAPRPNALQRAELKKMFSGPPNISHAAVFTGRNVLLNMAAKFVLTGLGFKSVTVGKTLEQALSAVGYESKS
jgi:hypothetical protein